ncbi:MAG: L-2-amino-thiazoline-4-carboxylic acid hydrolase [Candidatus Hodarchaeales archaeon]
MEINRLSYYNPDKKRHLNVHGYVETALLSLDRFLVYLAEKKGDVMDEFIAGLEPRYKSAVVRNFSSIGSLDLSGVSSKAEILMDYPGLLNACASFTLTMLSVPRDYAWEPQELDLLFINVVRASQLHFYYRAELLTELIDREEAIQLLKDYIDYAIANYGQVKKYEDLTSMYEDQIKDSEAQSGDWIAVSVENGRYVSRADRCVPYEVLKGFSDPELARIVACYGDYARIKKMNENFVLTRTQTQLNGPYCDGCIHDTRIVDKIEHPPKEMFENL